MSRFQQNNALDAVIAFPRSKTTTGWHAQHCAGVKPKLSRSDCLFANQDAPLPSSVRGADWCPTVQPVISESYFLCMLTHGFEMISSASLLYQRCHALPNSSHILQCGSASSSRLRKEGPTSCLYDFIWLLFLPVGICWGSDKKSQTVLGYGRSLTGWPSYWNPGKMSGVSIRGTSPIVFW